MGFEKENKKALKTGNSELDRLIGGIPIPSMDLVEGVNDSGKSVFVQQLTYGALHQGFKVRYLTTENTIKSLISQMTSITLDITPFFISGKMNITPLHVKGLLWDDTTSMYHLTLLLNFLNEKDKLPFSLRAGFSKPLEHLPMRFSGEVDYYPDEETLQAAIGGELTLSQFLKLRIGYNTIGIDQRVGLDRDALAGFAAGFGVIWRRLTFDYALTSQGEVGFLNRVTIGSVL